MNDAGKKFEKDFHLGFLISRASWALSSNINRRLKQNDLGEVSMGFFGVLMELWRTDGISISELGDRIKLEKSSMTGLLDRMEKANLVKRQSHPSDRRATLIYLTDKGRKIKPVVVRIILDAYDQLTQGVDNKNIEMTKNVLNQVIKNAESLNNNSH